MHSVGFEGHWSARGWPWRSPARRSRPCSSAAATRRPATRSSATQAERDHDFDHVDHADDDDDHDDHRRPRRSRPLNFEPEPAPRPAPAPRALCSRSAELRSAPSPTPAPPPAGCNGGGGVIGAHNADRAAAGLGGLCANGQLAGFAQNWAEPHGGDGIARPPEHRRVIRSTSFFDHGREHPRGPGQLQPRLRWKRRG